MTKVDLPDKKVVATNGLALEFSDLNRMDTGTYRCRSVYFYKKH